MCLLFNYLHGFSFENCAHVMQLKQFQWKVHANDTRNSDELCCVLCACLCGRQELSPNRQWRALGSGEACWRVSCTGDLVRVFGTLHAMSNVCSLVARLQCCLNDTWNTFFGLLDLFATHGKIWFRDKMNGQAAASYCIRGHWKTCVWGFYFCSVVLIK